MGNTHPLNHFPLRFLSPYQKAVYAISTQGRCFPQHGLSRFEGLISGSKIRNQNCLLKLLPRGEVPRSSSVRSRTFNSEGAAGKPFLRKASFPQALRKSLRKLKDASDVIGIRAPKSSADFQTTFRSVCLDLLLIFCRWPKLPN